MSIQKTKFFLLSLLLFVSASFAEKKPPAAPIHLVSDSATYDQKGGVAIYTGNVKVDQGDMHLTSNKLTVYLVNQSADKLVATGSPVHFSYDGKKGPIKGQGAKVEYFVPTKTIKITGNAIVTQNSDTVKGSTLSYDLGKELVKGSNVNMTLKPAE